MGQRRKAERKNNNKRQKQRLLLARNIENSFYSPWMKENNKNKNKNKSIITTRFYGSIEDRSDSR